MSTSMCMLMGDEFDGAFLVAFRLSLEGFER